MENMVGFEKLFAGIYKGKKVLITGHSGFKGSWMAKWLELMGAKVYGFSLPAPSQPNHLSCIDLHCDECFGDIRNTELIANYVAKVEPEIIFHLAAQALVRQSYSDPIETYSTNVMGTLNVLEACRKTESVRAVVVISSDKCYENKEWIWGYRENDPMGGFDPYSASKGCCELLTNSYRNSYFNLLQYGTKHSVLLGSGRAGNVIGGGDWADDRLIPDMVRAASTQQSVYIRNPLATRPWQHVLEPLSGYLMLGWRLLEGKAEFAEGWNFGPSGESNVTVDEVVKYSKGEWQNIAIEYSKNPDDAHEANLLMLDCSKANKLLHWQPVWQFDETIQKTIGWYKDFYELQKINTQNDLKEFVQQAQNKKIVWTQ
jgi:CDP-glucose 4,6-dehydratase